MDLGESKDLHCLPSVHGGKKEDIDSTAGLPTETDR